MWHRNTWVNSAGREAPRVRAGTPRRWPWPFFAAGVRPDTNFLPIAPLIAALIVVPVSQGRAGLRDLGARMIRWRVPWHCYPAAAGLPLVVIFGTAWLNVADGRHGLVAGRADGSVLLVMLFHVVQGSVVPATLAYAAAPIRTGCGSAWRPGR